MGRISQAIVVALLAGSAAAVSGESPRADQGSASAGIPVPAPGTVESVSGEVIRATASGWVPVRVGESLPDGTKVQLLRGAVLEIRFSPDDVRRFAPAKGARSLTVVVRRRP